MYRYPLPTRVYPDAARGIAALQIRLADVNAKDAIKTHEINILTKENRSLSADFTALTESVLPIIQDMDTVVDGALNRIDCELVIVWASQLRTALNQSLYTHPKDDHQMASYILRQIDPELWHRVKVKALSEKITIRALIEKLIADWLKG